MHESPSVFNYRVADFGPEVRPGLCLAIEPMVVSGSDETFVEEDDWTVSTVDGSDGSHWEHSVAVHDDGIWVLTAPDGGAAGLAPFGVVPREIA
jgi:methionyl aminopeptidase